VARNVSCLPHLGGHSAGAFLERYWQKHPLWVEGAFRDWHMPITPEELAGLACDTNVESRIVSGPTAKGAWSVRHGPFDDADFERLPTRDWSLLVQDVDKLIPDFDGLMDCFRFLPDWRVDDLMISYAVTGGSVGPHWDDYDVFLIQGAGHRQWRIQSANAREGALIPDLELKILRHFEPEQSQVLGPGDMLYLPPGVAHHGVALDDRCMTLSVGFRAPCWAELMSGFGDALLETRTGQARYEDDAAGPAAHPGTLTCSVRERIRSTLRALIADDPDGFDEWLGRFLSEPKSDLYPSPPPAPVPWRNTAGHFRHHRGSRLIYAVREEAVREEAVRDRGAGWLFANGESHPVESKVAAAVQFMADNRAFRIEDLPSNGTDTAVESLLDRLLATGCLEWIHDGT
jgi:50S ribosomal protein L16 3-hydroxylase